ncbi:MAG TPA: hypothetical protein VK469_23960 [Candidatus Kapabacteria bacterium]|nr:hypothetical protein [Candidatus Kapabacteria bacterium]
MKKKFEWESDSAKVSNYKLEPWGTAYNAFIKKKLTQFIKEGENFSF